MTDAMIIEAVRQAGASQTLSNADAVGGTGAVADPSAVARFDAVYGAEAPQAVDRVPFASEIAASWQAARADNQGILHRIKALSEMSAKHSFSAPEMIELQYEVANLAFQQEVVAKVADKSSNAIQTLVKNQ